MRSSILGLGCDATAAIPFLAIMISSDIRLDSQDRLDAILSCGFIKLHRTKKIAVISHCNRGHSKLLDTLDKRFDAIATIEQRIFGVQVKMNELA